MGANELVVDVAKIKRAAHNAIALNILTYTLPHDIEVYMEEVLDVFLAELGQKKLKDYIVYCLRELAVNAKKANTKRVYFDSRGLDINDSDQYEEGMTAFKQDTMDNIAWYLQKQKEKGYYIKIIFQAKGPNIILEVRNNVEINKKEYLRIHDKLARSRKYTSLEEALQQVLDPSEGAGLGLVILVLMLKKIGLDEDCFDIWAESGETGSDEVLTTSKSLPVMAPSACRSSLFQRLSGTPLRYQAEPLSATMPPKVCNATMIGRTEAGKAFGSTDFLSRSHAPMGGAEALAVDPAWWRAGQM